MPPPGLVLLPTLTTCPFSKRCPPAHSQSNVSNREKQTEVQQPSTDSIVAAALSPPSALSWHLVCLSITRKKSWKWVSNFILSVNYKQMDIFRKQPANYKAHLILGHGFVHFAFIILCNNIHDRLLLKNSSRFKSKVAKTEINLWFADMKLWQKWKTVSHMPFF